MVGLELSSFRTLRYCAWIISVLPKMEGLWVIWCVVRTSFSRATVCTLPCKQCWAKVKDQCNDIMNPEISLEQPTYGFSMAMPLPPLSLETCLFGFHLLHPYTCHVPLFHSEDAGATSPQILKSVVPALKGKCLEPDGFTWTSDSVSSVPAASRWRWTCMLHNSCEAMKAIQEVR